MNQDIRVKKKVVASHRSRQVSVKKKLQSTSIANDWGQGDREWLAWRQICKHLQKLGVSINEQEPLASAIRLWGEELVKLRNENSEHIEKARDEAWTAYEKHVLDNWDP